MSFLSFLIFTLCGYYFLYCTHKGQTKIGLRFYGVQFYPIVPRQTFTSSFFGNCMVLNLQAVTITQFCTQAFDGYFVGTSAAKIWNVQVRYMEFYSWVFTRNFFIVWAIVWWFIAFIYFCLKPIEKINLGIQVKKGDLSSKQ